MRELFTLWRHTRMVVLVSLVGALYAAILIPFKVGIVIIPGITEVRPANVIPVVCSLMFGPAAAWGAAFGNLIGDFFGTLGPGSFFGFIGNAVFGYIPYKVWGRMGPLSSKRDADIRSARQLLEYWLAALLASLACAVFIGWGVHILRIAPFALVANAIALNNFLVAAVLGPPLLAVLYPRVRQWGLLWHEILEPQDRASGRFAIPAIVMCWLSVIGGLAAGNMISLGLGHELFVFQKSFGGQVGIGLGVAPAIILLILACAML